jgi:hypothetical protein
MSHELPLCESGCGNRVKRLWTRRKGNKIRTRFCSHACVPASARHPRTAMDVFAVVCQLDVLVAWLKDAGYYDESQAVQGVAATLTGSVVLRLK